MNKYKMLFIFVIALCSLIPTLLYSQVDTAWVRRYSYTGYNYDGVSALAVDNAGNVYVTGTSQTNTSYDYATIKYNSAGVQQWVQRYNGPGNADDYSNDIAVDASGNVYITGSSPGSGTEYDIATIKYNSAGVQQWVMRYNGPGNDYDEAYSLALDNSGNIYVTGYSYSSGTLSDDTTIKYNSAGVQQWVMAYNGPGNSYDGAYSLALDNSGNVYVTGSSMSDSSYDYATVKYNSAGNEQWVKRYDGPGNTDDEARVILVDNSGNVYLTGYCNSGSNWPFATSKYNSLGDTLWVRRYSNATRVNSNLVSMAIDSLGNVYMAGACISNPSDYVTIKYSPSGDTLWVRQYNGPGGIDDYATAIAIDITGNIYITGASIGAGTSYDFATVKYNSSGVQQWISRYNSAPSGNDYGYAIAVDGLNNVYVAGTSQGSSSAMDYATIKYVQTQAIEEEHSTIFADRNTLEIYPNPAKTYFTIRLRLDESLPSARRSPLTVVRRPLSDKDI